MEDFKEVSLGFAEFVSQLIHETFDAIIESQNYQLEKYAELNSKLLLSDDAFKTQFISNELIEQRTIDLLGFKPVMQMPVNDSFASFLSNTFETDKNLVFNKKLTTLGFETIMQYVSMIVVKEQKEKLNAILNNSLATKIVIESGEINAKLELSSLYAADSNLNTTKPAPDSKLKTASLRGMTSIVKEIEPGKIKLPTFNKEIKIINQKDSVTGNPIIMIDKNALNEVKDQSITIPNLRLTVKPTKLTSNSNLYSEIKLNFKTV